MAKGFGLANCEATLLRCLGEGRQVPSFAWPCGYSFPASNRVCGPRCLPASEPLKQCLEWTAKSSSLCGESRITQGLIYIYKEAFNSLLIHFAAILSTLKHPRNKYNRRLTVRPKGSPTFLEGDPSHPATPGVSGIPRLLHIWRATPPNHWWTQFPDNSRQEKIKIERSFSSLHGFHWSPSAGATAPGW